MIVSAYRRVASSERSRGTVKSMCEAALPHGCVAGRNGSGGIDWKDDDEEVRCHVRMYLVFVLPK